MTDSPSQGSGSTCAVRSSLGSSTTGKLSFSADKVVLVPSLPSGSCGGGDVHYRSQLRLEGWANSLCSLISISSWVISLDPAVQFFSKVRIVGHQFVHMHNIWLGLRVALYLVRHRSRFDEYKPGSSVGVTQLASLSRIGSPDPFTMLESNCSIRFSITAALAFGRSL